MDAVGDNARRDIAGQGSSDKTGFTIAQLAHGIEKMGGTARTCGNCSLRLIKGAIAVSQADDRTRIGQGCNLVGGYGGRRDRNHQGRKVFRGVKKQIKILRGHWTDQAGIMCAFSSWIKMRAFEMKAQKSGRADGRDGRIDHPGGRLGSVSDQGWQKPRCAQLSMGKTH